MGNSTSSTQCITQDKLFTKKAVKEAWNKDVCDLIKDLKPMYERKRTYDRYADLDAKYSAVLLPQVAQWCKDVEDAEGMNMNVLGVGAPWCSEQDIFRILIGISALATSVYVQFRKHWVSKRIRDPNGTARQMLDRYKSEGWRTRWLRKHNGVVAVGVYKRAIELIELSEEYINKRHLRYEILSEKVRENASDSLNTSQTLNTACEMADVPIFTPEELRKAVKIMGMDPAERLKRENERKAFIEALAGESREDPDDALRNILHELSSYVPKNRDEEWNKMEPEKEIALRFMYMGTNQNESQVMETLKKLAIYTRSVDEEYSDVDMSRVTDLSEQKDEICKALFGKNYKDCTWKLILLYIHPDRCQEHLKDPSFRYPDTCNNAVKYFYEVKQLLVDAI